METTVPAVADTWALEDLYPSLEAFWSARRALESRLPELDRHRGQLGHSARDLAGALEAATEAGRDLGRLRCFTTLSSDADTRDPARQALQQEIELLHTELSRRTAWIRPEILGLEPARVEEFVSAEPRLAPFRFFLRDLLRQREHVLGTAEERILAESGPVVRGPSSLFQVFHDVELPRPEVTLLSGEQVRLTPVEFHRQRLAPVRSDRRMVFDAYFGAYGRFRETLGQNLDGALRAHVFRARSRRYGSCLAAALDGDNVPESVYLNLIARVREGLPLLHRYLRLRARALGLARLEYCDIYCALSSAPPRHDDSAAARRLLVEGLAPLGPEYLAALEAGMDSRWIDWHPTAGKRSGAYATGWAYDVHPYVLLNFTGDYDAVSTLAHEMGHAMHSYFSNRTQPYATADYSIFVAEVASTLNEALLHRRMLDAAGTLEERLYLVASYLDGVRGTLFRQTMFAEFELRIHERAERGEALTGERLSALYLELLREYHGHDAGVAEVAETFAVEWAAVPHFYYDFYVYQYATGIVAATALAEELSAGVPRARERYQRFLSSGGSDWPLQLLRAAGVDLETAEPYAATLQRFGSMLDELERLLALRS